MRYIIFVLCMLGTAAMAETPPAAIPIGTQLVVKQNLLLSFDNGNYLATDDMGYYLPGVAFVEGQIVRGTDFDPSKIPVGSFACQLDVISDVYCTSDGLGRDDCFVPTSVSLALKKGSVFTVSGVDPDNGDLLVLKDEDISMPIEVGCMQNGSGAGSYPVTPALAHSELSALFTLQEFRGQ